MKKFISVLVFLLTISGGQASALIAEDDGIGLATTAPQSRLYGSYCMKVVKDSNGSELFRTPCHHVTITDRGQSPNIHFDSESEDSGMSYITRRPIDGGNMSIGYEIIGYYLRTPSKMGSVRPATGWCAIDSGAEKYRVLCRATDSGTGEVLLSGMDK